MKIEDALNRLMMEAEGKTVVDAGCGNFNTLIKLNSVSSPKRCIGLDLVKPDQLPPKMEFLPCDFDTQNIPIESNSVDLLFSQHVIEHLREPIHYFSELVRVVKPHGKIFLETPSDKSLRYSFPIWQHKRLILSFYDDPTHIGRPWTPQSLYRLGEFFGIKTMYAGYSQDRLSWFTLPLEYMRWLITDNSDRFVNQYWKATGWVAFSVFEKTESEHTFNYYSFKNKGIGRTLEWDR